MFCGKFNISSPSGKKGHKKGNVKFVAWKTTEKWGNNVKNKKRAKCFVSKKNQ